MSDVKGKLITCDRCGETIFLKFIERRSADGGFSAGYDVYEDLPDEWLYQIQFGYLCDKCADIFRTFMYDFIGDRLAPVWKPKKKGEDAE